MIVDLWQKRKEVYSAAYNLHLQGDELLAKAKECRRFLGVKLDQAVQKALKRRSPVSQLSSKIIRLNFVASKLEAEGKKLHAEADMNCAEADCTFIDNLSKNYGEFVNIKWCYWPNKCEIEGKFYELDVYYDPSNSPTYFKDSKFV